MSPPLVKDDDHYILGKLCNELLPWMIAGRRVGNQRFVQLERVNAYGSDAIAALAGLGIGSPVIALMNGAGEVKTDALQTLAEALKGGWFYVGFAALLAWTALRVIVQRENVVQRAVLARNFSRSMTASLHELDRALVEKDPMPKISVIQKSVDDKVSDVIVNNAWPWDPPRPLAADIEGELEKHRTRRVWIRR